MDNYHLTKSGENWSLKKEGADRASKTFPGTKTDAIQESAKFLEGKKASLKIHKLDGKIQEERTFPGSADPKKSRG